MTDEELEEIRNFKRVDPFELLEECKGTISIHYSDSKYLVYQDSEGYFVDDKIAKKKYQLTKDSYFKLINKIAMVVPETCIKTLPLL